MPWQAPQEETFPDSSSYVSALRLHTEMFTVKVLMHPFAFLCYVLNVWLRRKHFSVEVKLEVQQRQLWKSDSFLQ